MEDINEITNNPIYVTETPNNGLDIAYPFKEGLALISKNDKIYFINKRGENAFPSLVIDAASSFSDGLAIIETDNKNGYVDTTGKIHFCELEIEDLTDFSEGLAFIKRKDSNNWVCINKEFKEVFSLGEYEPYYLFNEGYAVVRRLKKKTSDDSIWYYDDGSTPRENIDFKKLNLDEYNELDDLTLDDLKPEFPFNGFPNKSQREPKEEVEELPKQEYEFNFIDRAGKLLLPKWCLQALPFTEDFAVVRIESPAINSDFSQMYNCNYINKDGELLFEYNVHYAEPFSEGLGAIALEDDNGGLSFSWCYVNKEGELVMPLKNIYSPGSLPEKLGHRYSSTTSFSESVACVGWIYADGMDGIFIDHDGNKLFGFCREFANLLFGFKEGLAGFTESFGCMGEEIRQYFMDKTGTEVFADKCFEKITPFSEGLAAVKIDGQYHYINKDGMFLDIKC